MLQAQDNECAVCSKELVIGGSDRSSRANLDHNHTSGKVRGLLCQACNMFVGVFEDKKRAPNILKYLSKYDVVPDYIKEC